MTLQEILETAMENIEPEPAPPSIPIPAQCKMCRDITSINELGICGDCQKTVKRGYQISEMAGRCANGAQRDSGILWHARMLNNENVANWKSVCGRQPGRRSVGWSTWRPADRVVTCKRCLKKLEREVPQ